MFVRASKLWKLLAQLSGNDIGQSFTRVVYWEWSKFISQKSIVHLDDKIFKYVESVYWNVTYFL